MLSRSREEVDWTRVRAGRQLLGRRKPLGRGGGERLQGGFLDLLDGVPRAIRVDGHAPRHTADRALVGRVRGLDDQRYLVVFHHAALFLPMISIACFAWRGESFSSFAR